MSMRKRRIREVNAASTATTDGNISLQEPLANTNVSDSLDLTSENVFNSTSVEDDSPQNEDASDSTQLMIAEPATSSTRIVIPSSEKTSTVNTISHNPPGKSTANEAHRGSSIENGTAASPMQQRAVTTMLKAESSTNSAKETAPPSSTGVSSVPTMPAEGSAGSDTNRGSSIENGTATSPMQQRDITMMLKAESSTNSAKETAPPSSTELSPVTTMPTEGNDTNRESSVKKEGKLNSSVPSQTKQENDTELTTVKPSAYSTKNMVISSSTEAFPVTNGPAESSAGNTYSVTSQTEPLKSPGVSTITQRPVAGQTARSTPAVAGMRPVLSPTTPFVVFTSSSGGGLTAEKNIKQSGYGGGCEGAKAFNVVLIGFIAIIFVLLGSVIFWLFLKLQDLKSRDEQDEEMQDEGGVGEYVKIQTENPRVSFAIDEAPLPAELHEQQTEKAASPARELSTFKPSAPAPNTEANSAPAKNDDVISEYKRSVTPESRKSVDESPESPEEKKDGAEPVEAPPSADIGATPAEPDPAPPAEPIAQADPTPSGPDPPADNEADVDEKTEETNETQL